MRELRWLLREAPTRMIEAQDEDQAWFIIEKDARWCSRELIFDQLDSLLSFESIGEADYWSKGKETQVLGWRCLDGGGYYLVFCKGWEWRE